MKGTIHGSTSNQFIASKIEWESYVNDDDLSSTVTAALYYRRTNSGYVTQGWGRFTITVGDQTAIFDGAPIIGESWIKAVEITVPNVEHEADGTKTVKMSATGYMSGTSLSATYCSGEAELDAIPKVTTIDEFSCASQYFDGQLRIKYTPQSAEYTTRLVLRLGGIDLLNYVHANAAPEQQIYVVTLEGAALKLVYEQLTDTDHGTVLLQVTTFSDDGQIGQTQEAELTLYIPQNEDTLPVFTMKLSPASELPAAFDGMYIQWKSKVSAEFNGEAKYGAGIAYAMTVNGKNYENISDVLTMSGNVIVKGTATDTRGFHVSREMPIYVFPYNAPKIKVAQCCRCDKNGNPDDAGSYLLIEASREYAAVEGVNQCAIQYMWTRDDGIKQDWTPILSGNAKSNYAREILPGFAVEHTYAVKIRAIDTIGEHSDSEYFIPTDEVYWHRDGRRRSFSFGEYIEEGNTFAIAEEIKFKPKGIREIFPVGAIYMSIQDTDPSTLFGGVWERIKDTFLLAAGDTYAPGSAGGEAEHVLTEDETPEHNHALIRPQWYGADGSEASTVYNDFSGSIFGYTEGTTKTYKSLKEAKNDFPAPIEKTGGGQAHNNMPPYLAVYMWVRTE